MVYGIWYMAYSLEFRVDSSEIIFYMFFLYLEFRVDSLEFRVCNKFVISMKETLQKRWKR